MSKEQSKVVEDLLKKDVDPLKQQLSLGARIKFKQPQKAKKK